MANDGNVKIGVKLDDKGFKEEVSGLGSFAQKGFSAIGSTTVAVAKLAAGAVTAATGAIATGLGASVKVGAAFEAEMSKVSAISGATGDELSQLTEKAKEMGAATKFSASESAQAMEYMAMAGWKTTDMLSGIEGIMNLAAASGEDLATTSDIVTDALTAFGLSAADSTHFADVLAQASSNANTNVSLMGETFKYVAPVAGALGYSAEDTAVAIGLMANAGIKGSQAGTVLRSMMSRLAKPTKEVQGAMDRLGVSLTDNQGNMKSLDQIMLDLRKGFSGLSEAESANVAASLAGQEAMSGLLAIVGASDDDFDKLKQAIYNCDGASAQMAETMQNNLQGQLTILKSSAEGLGIEIYESIQEPLTGFAQLGIGAINELTDAFKSGGVEGLVSAGGELIGNLITGAVEQLPNVLALATSLLGSIVSGIASGMPQILAAGQQLVSDLITGVVEQLPQLVPVALQMLLTFAQGIIDNLPSVLDAGIQIILALVQGIANSLPTLIEQVPRLINSFTAAVYGALPKILAAGVQILITLGRGIINSIPMIIANAGEIVQAILNTISLLNLFSTGANIIKGLGSGLKSMFSSIGSAVRDLIQQIKNPFNIDWSSIGSNIIKGIVNGLKNGIGAVVNAAKSVAKAALNAAKSFLGIHSPSKVMRDVIGRNMVAGINVGIEDETPGLEKVSRQSASRAVEAMQDGAYRKAEATGAEATEKYSPGEPDDKGEQPDGRPRRWRVEVPVYLDGREMARGMAEFTNEQLAWEGL